MSTTAQKVGAKLDEVTAKVDAAAPQKLSGVALYSRFAFAGAVCCSVTHGGLTPVDVYIPPPLPISRNTNTSTASRRASNSTQ